MRGSSSSSWAPAGLTWNRTSGGPTPQGPNATQCYLVLPSVTLCYPVLHRRESAGLTWNRTSGEPTPQGPNMTQCYAKLPSFTPWYPGLPHVTYSCPLMRSNAVKLFVISCMCLKFSWPHSRLWCNNLSYNEKQSCRSAAEQCRYL